MQAHSKPVKPALLGAIGEAHFEARFEGLGCEMESFDLPQGRRLRRRGHPLPHRDRLRLARRQGGETERRLVTGVNWSPGIVNPFRTLGEYGRSLDSILTEQRVGAATSR